MQVELLIFKFVKLLLDDIGIVYKDGRWSILLLLRILLLSSAFTAITLSHAMQ